MLHRSRVPNAVPWCLLALCGCACGCDSQRPSTTANEHSRGATPINSENGHSRPREQTRDQQAAGPAVDATGVEPDRAPVSSHLQVAPDAFAEFGIQAYDSKRLRLFTDIDPHIARELPPLADREYAALESYFGPLPGDDPSDQVRAVGYLMGDQRRFQEAGLLPPHLPEVQHGEQIGTEFWLRDQEADYYRRHLMLHELVHWFMRSRGQIDGPLWYLEGIAEFLATHAVDDDGTADFGLMPSSAEGFEGFGRVGLIQDDLQSGRMLALSDVTAINSRDDFQQTEAYAWSWALCHFLASHPSYRDRFQDLAINAKTGFATAFENAFEPDRTELQTEWLLFVNGLQYGYDVERAAIDFRAGQPLEGPGAVAQFEVAADRGWQSSGVLLQAGHEYEIAATGRFTLAEEPGPWISEPQGISFRYFDGQPLGMLMGTLRKSPPDSDDRTMLEEVAIGRAGLLKPEFDGTLYLRINDAWNELADNTGKVQVALREVPPAQNPSPRGP